MLLPYTQNRGQLANQQFHRASFPASNDISESELLGSLFGLAHQLMAEVVRSTRDSAGLPPFMGLFSSNPHRKVFGVSAMNVTQITRGPDGRPHVVQTHNERLMGPGGIWQTKKALHDPDRGVDKVQIGYFTGDHGEVIERRFDRASGQYREDIQRRDFAPHEPNMPPHLPLQPPPPVKQQHPYYPRTQAQYPYYPPSQQHQALPPHLQQPISALAPYPPQQQQQQPALAFIPYPEKSSHNLPPPPVYPYI